ncbi:MAG: hypothetical protein DWQ01_15150 [Planctomycetota bacterium]|nr:MAG: hypothetical protein DWQ01_15150 [Planctomycetota bacterium]
MANRLPPTLAPARAGALAAMFCWLAVYLQLSLANHLGLSPLFLLWFGIGGALVNVVLFGALGTALGLLFRRGLTGVVVGSLLPMGVLTLVFFRSLVGGELSRRGDVLLGPTVQALALAFIGGAICLALVLVTGRGTRAALIAGAFTLLVGSWLARDPDRRQELANPHKLATDLQPAAAPTRSLVLAFDGLDWKILDRLLAEDARRPEEQRRLPNFSTLLNQGSRAPLQSFDPPDLPLTWTSLATGRHWKNHGVRGWYTREILGSSRRLFPAGTMAAPFLDQLSRRLPWLVSPARLVQQHDRRRRTFWEALDQAGVSTSVLGWPLTHPAPRREAGILVSDRAFAVEAPDLDRAVWPPQALPPLENLQQAASMNRLREEADLLLDGLTFPSEELKTELRRHLLRLLQQVETMERLLFENPDAASACFVLFDPLVAWASRHFWVQIEDGGESTQPSAESAAAMEQILFRVYRIVDRIALQRLLNALQAGHEDVHVILLSARGLKTVDPAPIASKQGFWIGSRPSAGESGVFLASGNRFSRRADLGKVSLLDFVPTLLYLHGLPVAEDLPGTILENLFSRAYRLDHEPKKIPTLEIPGWRQSLPDPLEAENWDKAAADLSPWQF